jgi:3-deoxy-D-manno-octulosonate 8-phosphate phosphatase (KDO 8-P phosphatase)
MSINPRDISLLVLDVDGVMTDGGIYVDDHGHEFKRYDVTDGVGIRVWAKLGFQIAIITGRGGDNVRNRAAYLSIPHVALDVKNKAESLATLCRSTGVAHERVAFLGDDWPDLSAMRTVGYPMAVANAHALVKGIARFVTARGGGQGAVREAVEHLLEAKGLMQEAARMYDASNG